MFPRHILMAYPNGYRIESAINSHMRDVDGRLRVVDFSRALIEWEALRALYVSLGFSVHVIEARPEFPDMVCLARTKRFHFWIQ